MNFIQHKSNNAVLGAPAGASIDECRALPITRVVFAGGDQACVSFWRPNAAELQLLSNGQPLRLCVMGATHPPLSVGVDGDGELPL